MTRSKTKPQRMDPKQVRDFYAGAQRKLAAAKNVLALDEEAAHEIAYEAMLKGTIALMLSYGQRLRSGPGHHEAAIRFAESKLDKTKLDLIHAFDSMRRKRNRTLYDVAITTRTEAEHAVEAAGQYLSVVKTLVDSQLKKAAN
jgi:uncharacterized protein (UPF0332 family)